MCHDKNKINKNKNNRCMLKKKHYKCPKYVNKIKKNKNRKTQSFSTISKK